MESQICIRAANGEIIRECRWKTRSLKRFLETQATSRVIVETCTEAFGVADLALSFGHEVRVVPATLVRSLGVGSQSKKTDKRDARILSEVSCRIDLPSVHIPSQVARQRKSMCGMREQLIGARTGLINCVRSWARGNSIKLGRGSTPTLPARVRDACTDLPAFVERLLSSIEELTKQIVDATKEIERLVKSDPLLLRLTTCPGIGPITAVRFVAATDDISRFSNAHQLESYLGLVPGEKQSGPRQHRLGITKAGSAGLRRCLVQAAWATRRTKSVSPITHWSLRIEQRRGKFVAIMAVARKLAGILFALWRDGTNFDAARSASATL
jgi:transposase